MVLGICIGVCHVDRAISETKFHNTVFHITNKNIVPQLYYDGNDNGKTVHYSDIAVHVI